MRRHGLLLPALWWAVLACAQPEVRLTPSDASQCLVSGDSAATGPVYPASMLQKRISGQVRVQLRIVAPDQPPRVTVLKSSEKVFEDAVLEWVQTLRAPCAGAGEAVLVQSYVFEPEQERVRFGLPQDADPERRAELVGCLQRVDDKPSPPYPASALESELQGRIHARLHFSAPDRAPQVELLYRPQARVFASPVSFWTQGYRMPCFESGRDQPITLEVRFEYRMDSNVYGFKPLSLLEFMVNVKGVRQQTLKFDTETMGCPFDVRLTYLMPRRPNGVGVVGDYRSEQEPLLQWLRSAELELPTDSLDAVFADEADIRVPCVRINLQPSNP